ncbi:hypothetical protein [Enterobacter hormaechei]|uniref:hypothetical protein n=1 Tax=Enterobacter hormaechei TaxID=158836 RepID=UPI003F524AA8
MKLEQLQIAPSHHVFSYLILNATLHEFAFVFYFRICQPAPALARLGAPDAPALKATR